jgi:hypothetical protein
MKTYCILGLALSIVSCGSVTTNTDALLPSATTQAVKGSANAATTGYFAPPIAWPLVAVHASTLPNGKVITWASSHPEGTNFNDYLVNKTTTAIDLWDPSTDAHSRIDNSGQDLVCSGHALNADGNLVVTGGHNGLVPGKSYSGANTAYSYNPFQNAWSRLTNMTEGRWYPTTTALPNGEVVTVGGLNTAGEGPNTIPDVLQTNNTWRRLTNVSVTDSIGDSYPWNHVAPNGQLFTSGPAANMALMNTSSTGSWGTTGITRDTLYRTYGTSIMYDTGKLLVLGGGTSSAVTIDLNNNAALSNTNNMSTARTFMNATVLPNGQVFVNGGNTDSDFGSDANSVYNSEIWNPKTGQWTVGARAAVPRNYHSVSLLLPDGRVLTTGSRLCGAGCTRNYLNAEIYYPPYLFKNDGSGDLATRPSIRTLSSFVQVGKTLRVFTSGQASSISRITLVRMGSTTHAFNMDQRFLELTFSRSSSSSLTVRAPANTNIAPPGYYILTAIDNAGVPSVGSIIQIRR